MFKFLLLSVSHYRINDKQKKLIEDYVFTNKEDFIQKKFLKEPFCVLREDILTVELLKIAKFSDDDLQTWKKHLNGGEGVTKQQTERAIKKQTKLRKIIQHAVEKIERNARRGEGKKNYHLVILKCFS